MKPVIIGYSTCVSIQVLARHYGKMQLLQRHAYALFPDELRETPNPTPSCGIRVASFRFRVSSPFFRVRCEGFGLRGCRCSFCSATPMPSSQTSFVQPQTQPLVVGFGFRVSGSGSRVSVCWFRDFFLVSGFRDSGLGGCRCSSCSATPMPSSRTSFVQPQTLNPINPKPYAAYTLCTLHPVIPKPRAP